MIAPVPTLVPAPILRETTRRVSLTTEYLNQFQWRDWQRAVSLCPIGPGQQILDLGCGPGSVTAAIAARGVSVLGIDNNPELIATARERHPDCVFEEQDLNDLRLPRASFDGLWCSFATAYLIDFERIFTQWCAYLKPSAWVCLIDIDDLFGHEPMSESGRHGLKRFYDDAISHRRYDFRAGSRLASALQDTGFEVQTSQLADRELAFEGPASCEILDAWRLRLKRMVGLQAFFGAEYPAFETEFLSCLTAADHRSLCKVVCCIGSR